jgi:hypothetical protein
VEGVDDERVRLQPQQSPKRTGNIFTAGLKTLFLNIPFYFWWINGDHFASCSKQRHKHERLLFNTSN